MHDEGWQQRSIAGILHLSRQHVGEIVAAFKRDGFAGLEDQRTRPADHPANQLSLPFLKEVLEVQREHPRAGRVRVRGLVAKRTGREPPSERTVGRAMALNRQVHGAPPAWPTDRPDPSAPDGVVTATPTNTATATYTPFPTRTTAPTSTPTASATTIPTHTPIPTPSDAFCFDHLVGGWHLLGMACPSNSHEPDVRFYPPSGLDTTPFTMSTLAVDANNLPRLPIALPDLPVLLAGFTITATNGSLDTNGLTVTATLTLPASLSPPR